MQITTVNSRIASSRLVPSERPLTSIFAVRARRALGILGLFYLLLIVRLWSLQVVGESYYRSRSENNRIRTVYVPPARGIIYDRDQRVLAKNRPAFEVDLVPEDAGDVKVTLGRLAQLLALPPEQLMRRLHSQKKRRRFEPKLILQDVSRDVVAKVLSHRYDLPGIVVNVVPARGYVYGPLAAHAIGYIREITQRQIDSGEFDDYLSGDVIGQYGIEGKLEESLQGKRGVQSIIVNAVGTRIGEAAYVPETVGKDVTLTIDIDVQRAADMALEGKSGAIVAMSTSSGELLALSSSPAFDPNIFARPMTVDEWKDVTSAKHRKLNNRALQGYYPPGSVFKIITAAAILSEHMAPPSERVFCPGYFSVGRKRFRCHKHAGHGSVNLDEALVQSCDVYFYTMGMRLGVDKIAKYANLFGLGEQTGLGLALESGGIVPSTEWKRKYFKRKEDQRWYAGETPSVAIGQGALTTSPLQIARAVAVVANGGKLLKPKIILDGQDPVVERVIDLDQEVFREIRNGLEGVVYDTHGTGHRAQLAKIFAVQVAGKTGTAQSAGAAVAEAGNHHDHAWFAGYAPADKPELVVVALIENGGHGGVAAAPAVKAVMQSYFAKRKGLLPIVADQIVSAAQYDNIAVPPKLNLSGIVTDGDNAD